MLKRSPCLLCSAATGPSSDQLCQDCQADLPIQQGQCLRCGAPMPYSDVCARCLIHPPAFDSCIAAYLYHYPIDLMIKKIKYQARLDLVHPLSKKLVEQLRLERVELPECLVPVPLHRSRFRKRGFNQSEEIARALAKKVPVPIASGLLRRHKVTAQQYDLSPTQRRINVKDAFSIVKSINYKRIALVDDVVTTGATTSEVAKLLKRNGVDHVQVWSLARAVPNE